MPVRSKHKRVTWKVDRKVDPPTRHRQYIPDVPIPEEAREKYETNLVPGTMFVLNHTLRVMPDNGREPPPFPYAIDSWYVNDIVIGAPGHFAIYAGTVRVEETTGKGTVRVPRHSFIINGCRYLMFNLNLLSPAL
jgi:hypothetical protein